VLGYNKLHKGTDFAAPTGTPIYAAGNGKVVNYGPNGTYGNFAKVQHANGYTTAYAHMSRFAKGVSKGSYVKQGQVIGYVGTTGRSTGPHLHYEVYINNKPVNAMTLKTADGAQARRRAAAGVPGREGADRGDARCGTAREPSGGGNAGAGRSRAGLCARDGVRDAGNARRRGESVTAGANRRLPPFPALRPALPLAQINPMWG
jgi:murein DD-endopeptidase MepM/ murein hydrolase activator NlpD